MAKTDNKELKLNMPLAEWLSRYTVNDNVKVYQKIIQKYTISTECCKGTKSLLYITYC